MPAIPTRRACWPLAVLVWLRSLLTAAGSWLARLLATAARGAADLLARWPRLALVLDRATRWCRAALAWLRRRYRAAAAWCAPYARPVGRVLARLARALRAVARLTWRLAVRVWRAVWPYVLDAAGWLWHTAPRLALRLLFRALRRFLRWAPGALARLLGWSVLGAVFVARHGARYCIAYHDYGHVLRQALDEDRPRRVLALRRAWRRAAARRCGTLALLALIIGVSVHIVISRYGTLGTTAVIVVAVAVLGGIGRAVRPPAERPPGEAEEPDPAGPYPIADAHTRAEAADCLARALAAEGIELRMAGEAARQKWGWEVPVVLRTGTPAAIVAKTGELETHLDLPAGGVLATPDITRRARVMLRLAERDPFTDLHPAPPRAPGSASVTERVVVGRRIDGGELAVPLLGVHAVVVGSSGSGKSTTLLALGDAVTACTDALAWDLDPAGVGLDALGDAVDRRERDMPGIEAALADALAIAEARPRMYAGHGMRNAWEPAPDKAALVVFVDEYPRLSTKAKELAVHLLRIGRKSRVTLILAATEATTDALGAAVAESTGLQIMHSCRHGDVRLVFGPQRIAEGWRPDRLHPATADDPGQAGQCYVATAGHREPLVSKIAPRDDTGARHTAQPTAGRHAAGRARLDSASWQAARTRPATGHRSPGGAGGREDTGDPAGADRYVITDVLACFGPDARLWTEELLARLADRDPDSYTAWSADDLATALRPLGIGPIQIKRAGANRRGYDRDTITAAWQAQHDGDRP